MCGRFTLTLESIVISERFDVQLTDWKPRFNIAPTQTHPVILMENHHRRLDFMQWGLIPHWSVDKKSGYSLINSRVETIQTKPIFYKLFQTHRCLVPADGFFEWKKTPSGKIPYRISLKSEGLFAFAGLWDIWHGEKGEEIKTFTIITTEANSLVSEVHNRMPLILRKENEALWLDLATPQANLVEALNTIPANDMMLYEVSTIVNSWKTDNLKCIQPA